MKHSNRYTLAALCALIMASFGTWAGTHTSTPANTGTPASEGGSSTSGTSAQTPPARTGMEQARDTAQQVNDAVKVVQRMEADPKVARLLQQAKGVFIVPQYGRGGLIVGGSGGEGVMLVNNNGRWSNPVFYNIGSVTIGAQAGGEAGSVAMLLMNNKAVNNFRQNNKFSLDADAGLTIANYEAKAGGRAGRNDVIVWSDTRGAFAEATIGITDITFDEEDNRAFYGSPVAARDILAGKVRNAQATALIEELSGVSTGSSGTSGQ